MAANNKLVSVDLRPNRSLIDSKFESYKLSLATLPSFKAVFDCGIHKVPVTDDHISYEKIKCLTMHNYLVSDKFNPDNVYFVDSNGCIRCFVVSLEAHIDPPKVVFSFGPLKTSPKLPTTLLFPSTTICIACDGLGEMFILHTGDRRSRTVKPWSLLFKDNADYPTMLLSCCFRSEDKNEYVDVVLLHFETQDVNEKEESEKETVVVEWISLSKNNEAEQCYQIDGSRIFKGKSFPNYVALSSDCSELHLASSSPLDFVPGWSADQVETDVDEKSNGDDKISVAKPAAPYRWRQTGEDVTVRIPLPSNANKSSVVYSLSQSKINLGVRRPDSDLPDTVLQGNLYLEADPEASSWIITDGQLEVTIQKRIEGHTWPCIVEGDDSGELDYDPEEVAEAHEKLAHLTSDTVEVGKSEQVLFNSGQTEECDSFYDCEATLVRFDGALNRVTHSANISSLKWMFNCCLDPEQPPCFVLRHDVDGVVWQPSRPSASPASRLVWKHQATFNALGYVHASKTNVKFCSCAFDASYAALCECQRRIFVYRQPSPLGTSLRNRNSGEVVGKVALQQVATLDSNDDIYGFVATNERMFVLTEKELVVFRVAVDEGA